MEIMTRAKFAALLGEQHVDACFVFDHGLTARPFITRSEIRVYGTPFRCTRSSMRLASPGLVPRLFESTALPLAQLSIQKTFHRLLKGVTRKLAIRQWRL